MATSSTPGSFQIERRRAVINAAFKGMSVPVEKASRFVVVVTAAHKLGDAAFGSYQFASTLTVLLMLCTELGLGVFTTRAVARDRTRARIIVGTALRMRGLAVLPYLATIAIIAAGASSGDARAGIALLGLTAIANAMIDYAAAIFRGFDRLLDEAWLNVVRAAAVLGGGICGLRVHSSVAALSTGLLLGTTASAAYGMSILHRRYDLFVTEGGQPYDRDVARRVFAEGMPLWLVTALTLLYSKGDIIILRTFTGIAEVGSYSAADKLFEGLAIISGVVMAAGFPPLVRAYGDRDRQRRWEALLISLQVGLGVSAGAILYLGAATVIPLVYGPGYERAVPPLQRLAIAAPVMFVNGALSHILIARNAERVALAFAAIALVVNLGANLLLIPRQGGFGAASATVMTEATMTLCCVLFLARSGSFPSQSA